ncbi:alanine racemase C-terminal domain-containing protein [Microbacterium sp. RD1]|uniref:alanine racemase C-terminal domain-containing protein n=1 Tax=Microbacterium sp. RD1 TaxID=3457313 RepID=UPI003FA5FBBF
MSAAFAAPRAVIDRTALVRNIRAAASSGAVDLRRDAHGLGFGNVLDAVLAGTDVDVVADAADVRRAGRSSSRLLIAAGAGISAATALGVDGSGTSVVSLRGTVLSVKDLRAGEGVSYGYTHRATADTRIALVSGGYGQGVPRSVGNRVRAVVAGGRHPVIGRVAMDVCMLDIGSSAVDRGDEVTFLGDPVEGAPSVAEWAEASGLGAVEILVAIGLHARREYRS